MPKPPTTSKPYGPVSGLRSTASRSRPITSRSGASPSVTKSRMLVPQSDDEPGPSGTMKERLVGSERSTSVLSAETRDAISADAAKPAASTVQSATPEWSQRAVPAASTSNADASPSVRTDQPAGSIQRV